jgi:hypothetical protein
LGKDSLAANERFVSIHISTTMAEPQIAESVLGDQRRKPSTFRRCLDCLRAPRQHHFRYINHTLDRLIESFFWKALIIFFTVLLLFGSPIQFLVIPKGGDIYFDVLYMIALAVFTLDMIFNIIVYPDYFSFDPLGRNRVQQADQAKFCTFGIGSYMFWCDVLSTAALLYDISYINRWEYDMEVMELDLNGDGVPVSNLSQLRNWGPFLSLCLPLTLCFELSLPSL